MGFSMQEYWNGSPFPSPGDLPDPGIKPRSSAFQADSLLTATGKLTVGLGHTYFLAMSVEMAQKDQYSSSICKMSPPH